MGIITDKGVKALGAGTWGCGGGLYLRVIPSGARQWFYRYKRDGKTTWLGLGGYPTVGLSEARNKAAEEKKKVKNGGNPLAERQEARKQALTARERTFERVAELCITAREPGWKGVKQGQIWRQSLKDYAFPEIGKKPVNEIRVADVLACLTPIWETKTETASRTRNRIEAVLDYATAHGWREGENPAAWNRLKYMLAAPEKISKVEHHPAVPWADLPAVMAKLAESEGLAALCLRFAILTAVRSKEVRGARWEEIDMAAKIWTVPEGRMKGEKHEERAHRVPLSSAALAVLRAAYPPGVAENPGCGLVFPSVGNKGQIQPLSDVSLTKALHVAGGSGFTVHGTCRSTFRDWAAERTTFPREVVETALAHINTDKTELAYLRGDHIEKRRLLMQAWANHATGTKPQASNVAELRRA